MASESIIAKYIEEGSSEAVRGRTSQIVIKQMMLDDDNKIAFALVKGSQGNSYNVHVRKYDTNLISSNCSCPYDWDGLCKHEITVLRQIDNQVKKKGSNQIASKIVRASSLPDLSKTAPYIIPSFVCIDNELIQNHSKGYNDYYVSIDTSNIEAGQKTISFTIPKDNNYWQNSNVKVEVEHKDKSLVLSCDCETTNKYLCRHQAFALIIIKNQLSPHFFNEAYTLRQWELKLDEYGYTLRDNYLKFFKGTYIDGHFAIKAKVEGLMPVLEENSWKDFSNKLVSKSSLEDYLYSKNADKKQQSLKVALGFSFYEESINTPINAKLLIGKASKTGELVTKISKVYNLEDIQKSDMPFAKLAKLYQLASPLFDENVSVLKHEFDAYDDDSKNEFNIANNVLGNLSKLINGLDSDILCYKVADDYYSEKITKKDIELIKIVNQSANIELLFTEEEDFYKLECLVLLENEKYKLPNIKVQGANFFAIIEGKYYLHRSADFMATYSYFLKNPIQRIQKSELENYLTNFLIPLQKKYHVEIDIASFSTEEKELEEDALSKKVYMSEVNDYVVFKPMIAVEDRLLELEENSSYTSRNDNLITNHNVSKSYITQFEAEMAGMHPDFEGQQGQSEGLFLSSEQFGEKRWFLDAFEYFKEKKIEVFGYDKFKKLKYNIHKPNISVGVSSEIDWFDVSISVTFGEQTLSLNSVKKAVLKQESYVKLDDGTLGYLPEEWLKKMERYFRYGELKEEGINISKYHFSLIDELFDEIEDEDLLAEIQEKKNKLISFESIKNIEKPKGVTATLREYQVHGINWLNFLNEFKMGGCLADDMGLGKTLQVISLLQHQKNQKIKLPSLVVVPTSLIFNWQNEVDKFAPKLKVKVISGANRVKNTKDYKKYDIILITYGLILRDIDYLKDYRFNYAILDESQAIKNPNSKRYKAVRLLKADNRLVMTGTPVENGTMDLYSQMSFVNPGLLGSATFFKDYFAKAIEKDKDEERTEELKKLIKPFLIRRTKEQVATELPDKTEMTLYCELEPAQKKVYDTFRDKYKNYLLGKIDEEGIGKSKMYVLEGLLKLRQICNSPALLADKEDYGNDSIKIKELLTQIKENTGEHKILVFSQFVKMLALIKTALDEESIEYEYLDGKTKNRQERVNNFQHNEKVRVFLISLKAGGTGLNLTSADYVYIVDPWWNPAVEAQAIDRCYRIGQDKHVMAYKMICKGTVEEKIVELQERKMKMVKEIVSTDDSILKSLTKSDIENLFS